MSLRNENSYIYGIFYFLIHVILNKGMINIFLLPVFLIIFKCTLYVFGENFPHERDE